MTIYLVDIEAVETRYTAQWKKHLPKHLLKGGLAIELIIQIPKTFVLKDKIF